MTDAKQPSDLPWEEVYGDFPVGQWLREMICFQIGKSSARELYAGFRRWCLQRGMRAVPSRRYLGLRLGERNFEKRRFKDGYYYMNVKTVE